MTNRHRDWRAWLAVAVSACLAGAGTLVLGRAAEDTSVPGTRPAGGSLLAAQPAQSFRQALPPAVVVREPAEVSPAAAAADQARRRGQRALGTDATGAQLQLPARGGTGPAPGERHWAAPGDREPGLFLPAWRALLESRWQERLAAVTELSLAYHDAAERSQDEHHAGDHADARQLRQLMREAVAARLALSDTEEALARLPAGDFGRCEHCAAAIPVARLERAPEARYCARCAPPAAENVGSAGIARDHARPRLPLAPVAQASSGIST